MFGLELELPVSDGMLSNDVSLLQAVPAQEDVMFSDIIYNGQSNMMCSEFANKDFTVNERSVDGNIDSAAEPCGYLDFYDQQQSSVSMCRDMSYTECSSNTNDCVVTDATCPVDTSFSYQDSCFLEYDKQCVYDSRINDDSCCVGSEEINGDLTSISDNPTVYSSCGNYVNGSTNTHAEPLSGHDHDTVCNVGTPNSTPCHPEYFKSSDSCRVQQAKTPTNGNTSKVQKDPNERIKNEMFDMYVMHSATQCRNSSNCDPFVEPVVSEMNDVSCNNIASTSVLSVEPRCLTSCERHGTDVGDYMCKSTRNIITRARFFFHSFTRELLRLGSFADPDEMTSKATGVSVGVVRQCTDLPHPLSTIEEIAKMRAKRNRVSELGPIKLLSGNSKRKLSEKEGKSGVRHRRRYTVTKNSSYACIRKCRSRSEKHELKACSSRKSAIKGPKQLSDNLLPFCKRNGKFNAVQKVHDNGECIEEQVTEIQEPKGSYVEHGRRTSLRIQKREKVFYGAKPRRCVRKSAKQDMSAHARALPVKLSFGDAPLVSNRNEYDEPHEGKKIGNLWTLESNEALQKAKAPKRNLVENTDQVKFKDGGIWDTPRRISERKKRPRRAFSPANDLKSGKGLLMVGSVCRRLRFVRKNLSSQSPSNMLDLVKVELEDVYSRCLVTNTNHTA